MPFSMDRRTVLFVQARMNSERLPGKMLRSIYDDLPLIYFSLQAADNIPHYDDKALLVPYGESKYFIDAADEFDFPIIEGPENDVLGRFMIGLNEFPNAELVIRVCADKVIFSRSHQHYAQIIAEENFGDLTHYQFDPIRSVTAGTFKASSLVAADMFYSNKMSTFDLGRENIKPLFTDHSHFWNIVTVDTKPNPKLQELKVDLSINTEEDIVEMRKIFSNFYTGDPLDFFSIIYWFDKK